MKKRVLTGAIIVLVVALAFVSKIWTNYVFDLLIGALGVVACVEMARVFERMKKYTNITVAALFAPMVYLAITLALYFELDKLWYILIIFGVVIVLALVTYIIALLFKKNTSNEMEHYKYEGKFSKYCFEKMLNTFVVMIYPGVLFAVLFILNNLATIASVASDSILAKGLLDWFVLVSVFAISMITDTFAMFTGMLIKGPKLCPRISPKKTISGAIGGLVGGIFISIIVYLIFMTQTGFVNMFEYLNLNVWYIVFIGFMGSVFDQFGDILASIVKRRARVKDYGTLLPGHGGIMDRVDGLIANSLFMFFFVLFII